MKKALLFFILWMALYCLSANLNAQNCLVAVQPQNVVATDAGGGQVQVTFDIGCGVGDRNYPPGTGNTACPAGDAFSTFWYVGLYGTSSAAPNGLTLEYGSGTFYGAGCNLTQLRDGGVYGPLGCLDPKGSTCVDLALGQLIAGQFCTFDAQNICQNDVFGTGAGTVSALLDVCDGMAYDVYVWEIIVDQPPNSCAPAGSNAAAEIACGNWTMVSESAASSVATVNLISGGGLNVMSNPVIDVSGATSCAAANGSFTNTHQMIPDNTNAVGCAVTNSEGEGGGTELGNRGGTLVGASDLVSSVAFTDESTRGSNTILLNCRDEVVFDLPTPLGCKGTISLTGFGQPLCNAGIMTTTNAAVYFYANGNLINPNTNVSYPGCFGAGSSTATCPPNTGSAYPNNYTARFGPFIVTNGGGSCITNVFGNPFSAPISPFTLPGTTVGVPVGATDGIVRQECLICLSYEDDCNGTKAVSCVKFLSDVPPMSATVRTCNTTCPAAQGTVNDGQIIIESLTGGAPDKDADFAYGEAGIGETATPYTFNVVGPASPTFTHVGSGRWETPKNLPPGVYTITIVDPLATNCGSACEIELVAEVLDPPVGAIETEILNTPTCGALPDTQRVNVFAPTEQAFPRPTVTQSMAGPFTLDGSNAGNNGCAVPSNTVDNFTFTFAGLYVGFDAPDQIISATSIDQVCLEISSSFGDGDVITLIAPNGSSVEIFRGSCLGGGGAGLGNGCVLGDYPSGTICFATGGAPQPIGSAGTYAPENPFSGLSGPINGNWGIQITQNNCNNSQPAGSLSNLTLSINDRELIRDTLRAFATCGMAPTVAGTAPANSPNGVVTWASADGKDPGLANLQFHDAQNTMATFTSPNLPCDASEGFQYSITAYYPSGNHDNESPDADCDNGECCYMNNTVTFNTLSPACSPPPAPTVSGGGSFCAATDFTGLMVTSVPNTPIKWYADAALTNPPLAIGTTYNPPFPAVGMTSTYYVVDTMPCISAATMVSVTHTSPPTPPTVTGGGAFCEAGQFSGFTAQGTAVEWYDNIGLTGTPVATGNTFTPSFPAVGVTETYYAVETDPCPGTMATEASVTNDNCCAPQSGVIPSQGN